MSIRELVKFYKEQIASLEQEIEGIQKSCPHDNIIYKACGSRQDWDRTESYWYDVFCIDCGKGYTTDQEYSFLKSKKNKFEVRPEGSINTYIDAPLEELLVLKKHKVLG